MKKKISKATRDKALQVALDLVSEVRLQDIWGMVADSIEDRHDNAIMNAIDPLAIKEEKKIDTLREALARKLNQDAKGALALLEDAWWSRVGWRQTAGFYMGLALAVRLQGRKRRTVLQGQV
jgi:hypothetical protein